MAKSRHYGVKYAFPVRTDKGKVIRITPRDAEKIEELMTAAQIKVHLEAGNLTDNGAAIDESPKAAK